ncbi:MAG: cupin-like domain-containing protein [Pseudomonadota bacterium]
MTASAEAADYHALESQPGPFADLVEDGKTLRWHSLETIACDDGSALRAAIADRRAVVVSDMAAQWPALRNWSPNRLKARFGEREVRVYDASFGTPGKNYMGSIDTMSFGDFLDETQERGRDLRMFLYNLSRQIPEILDDIVLPEVGLRFSRSFVFSFFGCAGSTTPLHYDIDMGDVLHTVIRGRRRIRLFPPSDAPALYRHPCTVRSYVSLDGPITREHSALAHATGYEVVLEPGQTLYMPAGWWHEFHYLEAGMGVSLRASSPLWSERLLGVFNLLVASPFDRLANLCAPTRWFDWKAHKAQRNAALFEAQQPPTDQQEQN